MKADSLIGSGGVALDGPLLLTPRVFGDGRGFFFESWNQRTFEALAGPVTFVQDNHSRSSQGVLRGLHYQLPPQPQAKLVRCVVGEIFDVAVDLRRHSPTFRHWVGARLSATNQQQLWVPVGFAHGFLTLSDQAEVLYKTSDYWSKEWERAIRWDDPALAIAWPLADLAGTGPQLSDKDGAAPLVAELAPGELFLDPLRAALDPMKVLLTGATGQLGQALIASRPEAVELVALGRNDLDLADGEACRQAVRQHQPDWLLNAGAYTAVDRAESEPDLAMAVNAGAPQAFAEALADRGGRLLQVSTDFVFNGQQGSPYRPDQEPHPLGVYGATKAAGERAVLAALGAGRVRILRTSWVYGPVGANFCLTMLRLHALKAAAGDPLAVVADQVGCPTATPGLAAACWRAIGIGAPGPSAGSPPGSWAPVAPVGPLEQASGAAASAGVTQAARPGADPLEPLLDPPTVLHWSDAGAASWYDFAVAIGELGVAAGLLEQAAQVRPIPTAAYPTPAARPAYSLLDCIASRTALGLEPTHWRAALKQVLAQFAALQRRRDARP